MPKPQPQTQQPDQVTMLAHLSRKIDVLTGEVKALRAEVKGAGVTPVKWLSSGEAEVYLKGEGFPLLTRDHLKEMAIDGDLIEFKEFKLTPGGHYRFEVIGIAAKLRQGVA